MKMHVLLGLLILGFLLAGCAAPVGPGSPTGGPTTTYTGPGGTVTTTGTGGDMEAQIKNCTPGTAFTWNASGTSAGGYGSVNAQFKVVGRAADGTCQAKYTVTSTGGAGAGGSYEIDYFFTLDAEGKPKVVRMGNQVVGQ